jgi:hypothetical protein
MNATTSEYPVPDQNDFATEIIARRKRRRVPAITIGLLLVVLLGAAFLVGVQVQKHFGGSSSAAASGFPGRGAFAAAGRAPGAGFGGGAGAGFGGAAGSSAGTVTLIKGSTLYVTDASGNTVLVKLTKTSRVSKSTSTSAQTIHPGDTVTYSGAQASDGSTTAQTVTVTPAQSNG